MDLTVEEQAKIVSAGRDLIAADQVGYSHKEYEELVADLAFTFENIFKIHNIRYITGYEEKEETGEMREIFSDGTFGEWE